MQFYSSSNYLKSHNNLDLEIKLMRPQNCDTQVIGIVHTKF
jgi:hypothetical protein